MGAETRVNQALQTGTGSRTYLNEFNQQVREYDWEEFQARKNRRLAYTGKEDLNGKTMVIHHTWGLGDVLYSTPAIKALKEQFPKMKLVYISSFPSILQGNPAVDESYHWQEFEDFLQLGDRLKEDNWFFVDYDTPLKGGIDYKIHLRTKSILNEHLVRMLTKDPKTLSGDELAFVNSASNVLISRYKVIALDAYCWHLHVNPEVKSVYYYPTKPELEFARTFMQSLRKKGLKVITLMPYTSTLFKDYPRWAEVVKLCPMNYHWLLLNAHTRPGQLSNLRNVTDCGGAFQLRQSAAMVIEGDVCCSSDTGLLYVKAARGGKCVVTYGPHEPQPFLHHFPSAKGLRVDKLHTTPGMENMCSVGCYIDTTTCKPGGGHSPCLMELDPHVVADAVQEAVEGK